MQTLTNYQNAITIGSGSVPPVQDHSKDANLEHTYAAVLEDYTRALTLDPEFSYAYYNRGFVNSQIGNYAEAVLDFTKAISTKVNFAEAIYNRGLIYLFLEDKEKGCEDLSRAGELGIRDAYRVMKRFCYK